MSEPVVAQAEPYETELVAGENYAWCACGLSATQPFCDGSHKVTDIRPNRLHRRGQRDRVALWL